MDRYLTKLLSKTFRALKTVGALFLMLNILLPTTTAMAQAAGVNCTQSKITIGDIFIPTKFVPIIQNECSTDANGKARPLSFESVPYILVRAYGFLSGLVVYLFGFIVIFSGIQYSYGALDGNQSTKALGNLRDSIVAVILVFSAYAIVNTLVIVLKVPGTVSNTTLTSFFTPIQ